jgi:erythromycin esterase-like protein
MQRRVILWTAALVFSSAASAQDQTVTSWIRANAVPLKTVEARNGLADMEPLRKMIGNARIVSLGEATHGTREFFQLKHRMLEFLATEMGFTIFSIEANMPEAYKLNDYVLNGIGDPAVLLRGMYFWTWNTEEVLDMIKWMREFNLSGKGRVQFTGFDMQTTVVASANVYSYIERTEPAYLSTVSEAVALAEQPTQPRQAQSFGVVTGTFPVAAAAGKRVRYSGYIKTSGITNGYAGLWWRADSVGRPGIVFDNMASRGPRGTTDWQRYEIEFVIPEGINNINFGAIHPGNGTAWFSDLEVEIDGRKFSSDAFDFSLAALPARGFFAGGAGYDVTIDAAERRAGRPTLRVHQVRAATLPVVAPPAADIIARWQAIYDHLKSTSSSTNAGRWAVQNARVVLQALQSRANAVTRDQSMADNIKWILDENPNAKIVLWAHNGHVATGMADRPGSYRPMGAALREYFGSQMVVFGFSFDQGSFQAIRQPGGLQSFTVGSLPPQSLDATFGSAGISIFALDVRNAPPAIAPWLNDFHQTRWIGAVYTADDPMRFVANVAPAKTFDAILFVGKTTAARGLSFAR